MKREREREREPPAGARRLVHGLPPLQRCAAIPKTPRKNRMRDNFLQKQELVDKNRQRT